MSLAHSGSPPGEPVSNSGGTRKCGRCFSKQCLPKSLKAELDRQLASGDVGASALYCGDCVGDGCAFEEEQERKRMRRYAHESLARGEYVHPCHYMDEDAYRARFDRDVD